jgi:hypothetical protein
MDHVIKFDHGAVAAPLRERPNSAATRCAVFCLAGVLGVLAFIFSAVSPDDDEIQQEFAQGTKTRRCLVRNWKSIPNVRITLVNPVCCAIVPRRLPSVRCSAIERVLIPDDEIGATAFASQTSGRSPPTRSVILKLFEFMGPAQGSASGVALAQVQKPTCWRCVMHSPQPCQLRDKSR